MLHYIPKLKLDWEDTDTFFTDIAILADREEEVDGYQDVVPILRYIYYRRLSPMGGATYVYDRNSPNPMNVKLISTYDWYFIEEQFLEIEPCKHHYLPMTFKSMITHGIKELAYPNNFSPLDYNWRAYLSLEEAYLSLINAYLLHPTIREYVSNFNLQCPNT